MLIVFWLVGVTIMNYDAWKHNDAKSYLFQARYRTFIRWIYLYVFTYLLWVYAREALSFCIALCSVKPSKADKEKPDFEDVCMSVKQIDFVQNQNSKHNNLALSNSLTWSLPEKMWSVRKWSVWKYFDFTSLGYTQYRLKIW